MRVGREGALTFFRAWWDDRALLKVEFRFLTFAASFTGRLSEVTATGIKLAGDAPRTELVLPLTEDLDYWYADMRGLPAAATFERGLTVFFPYGVEPKDFIVFAEIKE